MKEYRQDKVRTLFEDERLDDMQTGLTFYRCVVCGKVVSRWDINEKQGCSKCGNTRIKPSNLSVLEKVVQIIKHPAIWKWGKM